MDAPLLDGPRRPDSTPAPPKHRVENLVPFVHVEDVERSIEFYRYLGFTVESVYKYRGVPTWAELRSGRAELMVCTDGNAIDPAGQGVLFYLYARNLDALRDQVLGQGVAAGEITDGTPGPKREMQIIDPDGYVVNVAEIETANPE
jgi:predicted enzyme related to lactoylglutathione lyase